MAGYSTLYFARETVTLFSSSGCRSTSSTLRPNSGSSSRNSTPLWASDTSPGRGDCPPPISAACEIVWCGALKGRRASRPPAAIFPATECILVVSSASSRDSGGRMVGILRASIVLPEPGAPIISTL